MLALMVPLHLRELTEPMAPLLLQVLRELLDLLLDLPMALGHRATRSQVLVELKVKEALLLRPQKLKVLQFRLSSRVVRLRRRHPKAETRKKLLALPSQA